jgi:biopolymer transport protein ExbD
VSAQAPLKLKAGIHVELAPTKSAPPRPDADNENVLHVAITDDGSVYVDAEPITPGALAARLKSRLSSRTDTKLFIKPDARTPYAAVAAVLDVARPGFSAPTLVAGHPETGGRVTLTGLDVPVGSLSQLLQNRSEQVVLVKADGRSSYAQVVQMLDECHSMGARAALVLPGR